VADFVETRGVGTIPDSERTAKPGSLIRVFLGANLSLSVMVFGWIAILNGLGFWEAVSAIVVGTVVGSLFVARTSLLGWRAATNNSVASGAYFGVRGRLVGSFVGLLITLQYIALTVWTGGEMVTSSLGRLLGFESSDLVLSIGYAVIALLIVGFAIIGYRFIVQLNSLIAPVMIVLVVLTVIALWGSFDASYAGDPELYALGSFWPTWLLAVLTAGVAGPVSYVTQTGDWARYISKSHSESEVVSRTFLAMVVGLTIPTVFGAFVATAAFDEFSFAAGFVAGSPVWLVVPLLLVGIVGSLGQGSINLYSMGLDLDAILPKLSRLQSTVLVALVATALVFVGRFVFDAEVAVTNSVLFLTALATAWASISMYMYIRTKGSFDQVDLQIFNSQKTGGRYWYWQGWNLKAVFAWAAGSVAGILGISSVDYLGPIAEFFAAVDLSVPAAAVVSVALVALLGDGVKKSK
jgi:purine-cytosine permease-like protein